MTQNSNTFAVQFCSTVLLILLLHGLFKIGLKQSWLHYFALLFFKNGNKQKHRNICKHSQPTNTTRIVF